MHCKRKICITFRETVFSVVRTNSGIVGSGMLQRVPVPVLVPDNELMLTADCFSACGETTARPSYCQPMPMCTRSDLLFHTNKHPGENVLIILTSSRANFTQRSSAVRNK